MHKRPKILIVDDESDFCEIMKGYFIRKDYNVSIAGTLKEGMASLEKEQPDILFLDNNLPDGQGWEAVDDIVEIIPQIRVFLISAHKNKYTVKGSNIHANIVVWEKPISFRVLNNFF